MWEHANTIVTIASFIFTAVVMLVTVTWRVSQAVADLRKAINESRDEIEAKQDVMQREFGETAAALRTKIHQVETWARDEFVRKSSFDNGLSRVEKMIESQFSKTDARLERMEGKIDARR